MKQSKPAPKTPDVKIARDYAKKAGKAATDAARAAQKSEKETNRRTLDRAVRRQAEDSDVWEKTATDAEKSAARPRKK